MGGMDGPRSCIGLLSAARSESAGGHAGELARHVAGHAACAAADGLFRGHSPGVRTLVVVPTLLAARPGIEELVEALEVRFLANRDEHLHFGLLTDFQDAPRKRFPEDESSLRLAQKRIEELNDKYRKREGDTFFLFHRPRRWNPRERIWMGYERKRGKLAELNALLRGGSQDRFSLIVGETAVLSTVKYVITLDTDTQLPRDSARQFVGAMAHPLNRARYDEETQRVTRGTASCSHASPSACQAPTGRAMRGSTGANPASIPYTRAVSDVYQDLFGEGSFIGKGIYEVDAFERALMGRFPENRILSHDLLEGCYARAGLLSDVQLYEEYPSRYSADVSRRHRWIRGDWQIARWVLPRVPGPDATRQKNPLSALSRWKIFDNLRRSLVPAALTVLLLLGWTVLSPFWFWTLVGARNHPYSSFTGALPGSVPKPDDMLLDQHVAAVSTLDWPPRRSGGVDARMPSLRGILQPGCDCADDRTDVDHAYTAAGMESVERPGSRVGQTSLAPTGRCGSGRSLPRPRRSI